MFENSVDYDRAALYAMIKASKAQEAAGWNTQEWDRVMANASRPKVICPYLEKSGLGSQCPTPKYLEDAQMKAAHEIQVQLQRQFERLSRVHIGLGFLMLAGLVLAGWHNRQVIRRRG